MRLATDARAGGLAAWRALVGPTLQGLDFGPQHCSFGVVTPGQQPVPGKVISDVVL